MTVTVVFTPLFRVQLDERVDSHNGDTGLDGALQLLDLAHAGLEGAGLDAVVDPALCQVEAVVFVVPLLCDLLLLLGGQGLRGWGVGVGGLGRGDALAEGVAGAQLGG